MIAQPLQLRHALSQRLGFVLTPEVCAWVEAVAVANPMRVPEVDGDVPDITASQDQRFFDFVNARVAAHYDPTTSRALARVVGDQVRGVVLFTNLGMHSVELVVASDGAPGWLTRDFLNWIFHFPFCQLGVERVTGMVRSDNVPALRLNEHLGFKVEGWARREFGDVDGALMGMLRSECSWIKGAK